MYIQPQAYDHFMETGEFPEKTILAMETPGSRESINQAGYFEKDFVGMAVAVKDRERYEEGWAYLSYGDPAGGLKPAAAAFPKETCFNCHAEHGPRTTSSRSSIPSCNAAGSRTVAYGGFS